jgi:hypothetical protein
LGKAAEVEAYADKITTNGVRLSRVLDGLQNLKGDLLLKKSKPVPETDLPSTSAAKPPLPNWWPSIVECNNKIREKYYG